MVQGIEARPFELAIDEASSVDIVLDVLNGSVHWVLITIQ